MYRVVIASVKISAAYATIIRLRTSISLETKLKVIINNACDGKAANNGTSRKSLFIFFFHIIVELTVQIPETILDAVTVHKK